MSRRMSNPETSTAGQRLWSIAGRWRTSGHVIREPTIPVVGTDIYELFPGGHFLVHHVDGTVGDQPVRAIEIIGEPDGGGYLARSFDSPGRHRSDARSNRRPHGELKRGTSTAATMTGAAVTHPLAATGRLRYSPAPSNPIPMGRSRTSRRDGQHSAGRLPRPAGSLAAAPNRGGFGPHRREPHRRGPHRPATVSTPRGHAKAA
jgi:hypothetical protein